MRKSAVLLAGGAGRRMGGVNKAQLTLGAETFIERQIRIVSQWADEIVVVTNDEAFASSLTEAASDLAANSPPGPVVRTTPDLFVREGPLAGLHAGLSAASHRLVWLLGCDQPAPDPRAAAWLADRLASVNGGEQGRFAAELPNGPERNAAAVRHLAALPRIGGRLQPLHAVYDRDAAAVAEELLRQGERRLLSLLDRIEWIAVEEREFAEHGIATTFADDVDTPEQYERVYKSFYDV
ncbi:molybdenum cofactor guanylyltransferase [Cohnella faecalis]|uniref:molybdenum cofactor guanylyltransferase n=1 Tax=Cohnella faecalis TaxID=2315694 RepID=UPI003611045C